MYKAFVIIAALLVCLLLMYLAAGALPMRVSLGRNSRYFILLTVRGREPRLEQSVIELMFIMRSSRLYGEIIIQGSMLDADTRATAQALAERHVCVTFVEDGEAPWIRKTNCWKYPAQ